MSDDEAAMLRDRYLPGDRQVSETPDLAVEVVEAEFYRLSAEDWLEHDDRAAADHCLAALSNDELRAILAAARPSPAEPRPTPEVERDDATDWFPPAEPPAGDLREALVFVAREYHNCAIGDETVTPLHPAVSWENCPNLGCLKARAALRDPVPLAAEVVGRIIDEHYRARREIDPKGPPVHECGSYCGADIAARLAAVR